MFRKVSYFCVILVAVMCFAGCSVPPPLAKINSFEARRANPEDKSPKNPINLCYEVEKAVKLEIQGGLGPNIGPIQPLDKGCQTVTPDRTTHYTLIATGEDDRPVRSETISVEIVQPPALVKSFEVMPQTVDYGQPVKICYNVEDAFSVSVPEYPGLELEAKDGETCKDFIPRYSANPVILVARNLDGAEAKSEERELKVNRPEQAHVWKFESAKKTIEKGQSVNLCFGVSEGSVVSIINSNIQNVDSKNGRPQCHKVSPTEQTVYTLQATGPNGKTITHPVTIAIAVTQPKPNTKLFTRYGTNKTELCYSVENVSQAQITTEQGWNKPTINDGNQHCDPIDVKFTSVYTLNGIGLDGKPIEQKKETILVPVIKFELRRDRADRPTGFYYEVKDFKEAKIIAKGVPPINLPSGPGPIKGTKPLLRNYSGKSFTLQAVGSDKAILQESPSVDVP